jgi:hypothetical protein
MKVLTISGGCECAGAGNIGSANSAETKVIVRAVPGAPVVVEQFQEGPNTVFEIDGFTLIKPVVALSHDAGILEVGETKAVVEFSGSIAEGSYPIALRDINPDPGGLDLTAPFTFEKTNVKRTSPGFTEQHTLSATDEEGNVSTSMARVEARHAVYQGFSDLAILNQAQIKALVNKHLTSIIDEYGGENEYVVPSGPSVPRYVYWVGPIGSDMVVAASLGGFSLPILQLPDVNITNDHDGTIIQAYWVVRSFNKLNPGSYNITVQ